MGPFAVKSLFNRQILNGDEVKTKCGLITCKVCSAAIHKPSFYIKVCTVLHTLLREPMSQTTILK